MHDALLAHAIIDSGVRAPPRPSKTPKLKRAPASPAEKMATSLGAELLAPLSTAADFSVWRAKFGGAAAMLVMLEGAADATMRARFTGAVSRLAPLADAIVGMQSIRAVGGGGEAFVADYFETGSAADLPALGWSSRRLLEFTRRAACALGELHAAGIVHGAIRPDNILLDGDLAPIFTEIGLRNAAADDTCRAPELAGGAEPDARSDIYSLGRVLEFLALGEGRNSGIMNLGLVAVVQRSTAVLASARPADVEAFIAAIDAAIAAPEPELPHGFIASTARRPGTWLRRRRRPSHRA